MSLPPELRPPGLWVPPSGKAFVLLPYQPGRPAANPRWLEAVLGSRIRIARGPGGTWQVARGHADVLLRAMVDSFGTGSVLVITDAAQQRKCGEACQNGMPEHALQCQCQCGGENHGGVADHWVMHDSFAIETTSVRRIFTV